MGGGKKQTIGYKYSLGMHMILCHGPIDCVYKIQVDKKLAWTGLSTGGQIDINNPSLFGGDEKEGGISGSLDLEMGNSDQGQNSYLISRLGPIISAHRGVVGLVLRRMYLGTTSYLKPWSFTGSRIYKSTDGVLQWYPEKAAITRDPENPIIYAPGGGGEVQVPVTVGYSAWTIFKLTDFSISNAMVDSGGVFLYSNFTLDLTGASQGYARMELQFYGPFGFPFGFQGVDNVNGDISEPDASLIADVNIPSGARYVRVRFVGVPVDGATGVAGLLSEDSFFHYLVDEGTFVTEADMNPAHIIREGLTDTNFGMGYPTTDIDDDVLAAVADTLYDEALGISLVWDRSMDIEKFIEEILRHIDAALFVSRTTGKFNVKLIRGDYNVEDLLILDKSNITSVSSPNRVAFGELSNSVTVKFWNHLTETDDSVTVSDTALAKIQDGQLIDAALNYPGFTTKRNATIAAQRDLKALSTGFFSCTIIANSDAKDLNLGSVFVFDWPDWQINNMVMRVIGISFGDGINNKVRIICTEDIYATSTAVVVVDPGTVWVDPSQAPGEIINQVAQEVTYFEAVQNLGQADVDEALLANEDVGYVMAAAGRPESAINARMWTDSGAGYTEETILDFCPFGRITSDLTPIETTFFITNFTDLDELEIGTYAQIGIGESAEFVRIDYADGSTGQIVCGRGCLDTTPRRHSVGDPMFFMDVSVAVDTTEYASGETVNVKLTAITGQGQYDLDFASEMPVELNSRAIRPYAPGQFEINAVSYPETPLSGVLAFTFVGRDRIQQTAGEIYDHTFGNIGPEVGTSYRLQGYIDGVLVHTDEPVTSGVTWTPSSYGVVKVEIHSLRDGYYSFQAATHEFPYTDDEWMGSEDGDNTRVSEESQEVRLTED